MSDLVTTGEDNIGSALFEDTSFNVGSNVHVALHDGDPGADGSSNELSGNGYSRESTAAPGDWSPSGNNPKSYSNSSEILFDQATGDWPTVSHVSLWDSSTGGECFAAYALDSTKTIDENDQARFPSGNLEFDLD